MASHVHIAAPIYGNVFANVTTCAAHKGVPQQGGVNHQGVNGIVCAYLKAYLSLTQHSKRHLNRQPLPANLLPGHRSRLAHLTRFKAKKQTAPGLHLHGYVVVQANPIYLCSWFKQVAALDNPACHLFIDQADALP